MMIVRFLNARPVLAAAQLAIISVCTRTAPSETRNRRVDFCRGVIVGLRAAKAEYLPKAGAGGAPMKVMHDYVIRMAKDELPSAMPFGRSRFRTLKTSLLIPGDRKKYGVGEHDRK